jgi:hypothetical protein
MGGTDVSLSNISASLTLGGSADLSIDDITLGGSVGLGLNDIRLNALPQVNAAITALPNIVTNSAVNAAITQLPEIRTESTLSAGITQLPEIKTDSKVDLGLDNIRIQELPPIRVELTARPFRLHLPLSFKFCLEVLGVKLLEFSICGEGMAIGEDYHPRRTEECK